MQRALVAVVVTAAVLAVGCAGDAGSDGSGTGDPTTAPAPSPGSSPSPTALALEPVAEGLDAPLQVLPDPWGELLVVEQVGRVARVRAGEVTTWLDLTDRVTTGGERGLLGVAFDPQDPSRLFVHYSGDDGETTLSRLVAGPDGADPGSEQVLLTVAQPASNHNGGQVAFGPDGMLYLGLGDGGAGRGPLRQRAAARHPAGRDPAARRVG